ncbi:MAG TPA: hypothetical protein VI386_18005 [Candidatus Sulfotelmatobacter sp.]
MNAVVDFPEVRYAVIEVLQTETGHERIVIAYPSEESLRDLIAAPSIVAFGFASRVEAIMGGEASFPNAVVCQRTPETMAGAETNSPRRLNRQRRGETGSMSQRVSRFVSTSCSDVLTWATVIFSSRSFVSTAIRMALGSSV